MGPSEKGRSNSAGPTSKWLELDPMLSGRPATTISKVPKTPHAATSTECQYVYLLCSFMFAWLARGPCQYIPTFHCHFFFVWEAKADPFHFLFFVDWTIERFR